MLSSAEFGVPGSELSVLKPPFGPTTGITRRKIPGIDSIQDQTEVNTDNNTYFRSKFFLVNHIKERLVSQGPGDRARCRALWAALQGHGGTQGTGGFTGGWLQDRL